MIKSVDLFTILNKYELVGIVWSNSDCFIIKHRKKIHKIVSLDYFKRCVPMHQKSALIDYSHLSLTDRKIVDSVVDSYIKNSIDKQYKEVETHVEEDA